MCWKKSRKKLHHEKIFLESFCILKESNMYLFVEKHLRWNLVIFDKIFVKKYSNTNRETDTLIIYRTITINKTINYFEQTRFIFWVLNFWNFV